MLMPSSKYPVYTEHIPWICYLLCPEKGLIKNLMGPTERIIRRTATQASRNHPILRLLASPNLWSGGGIIIKNIQACEVVRLTTTATHRFTSESTHLEDSA